MCLMVVSKPRDMLSQGNVSEKYERASPLHIFRFWGFPLVRHRHPPTKRRSGCHHRKELRRSKVRLSFRHSRWKLPVVRQVFWDRRNCQNSPCFYLLRRTKLRGSVKQASPVVARPGGLCSGFKELIRVKAGRACFFLALAAHGK